MRRETRSPIKAAPLREPGQSLHTSIVDLALGRLLPSLWICSILVALFLFAWVQYRAGWHPPLVPFFIVTAVACAACAIQFAAAVRRVKRLQLGRDGERAVGQYLDREAGALGARVVHDIPGEGFNVDHVVIARQGVFVVETKTHSKPLRATDARVSVTEEGLRVDGFKPDRDPLTQVAAASRWVSELLKDRTGQPVRTRGVVVFPGWFIEPMSRAWLNSDRPWVLEPKSLPAFICQEPSVLTDREVEMFANALARYVREHQAVERKR